MNTRTTKTPLKFEYYKYNFKGVFISQHQKGFLALAMVALAHILHPAAAVPVPDHRHKGLSAVSADNTAPPEGGAVILWVTDQIPGHRQWKRLRHWLSFMLMLHSPEAGTHFICQTGD